MNFLNAESNCLSDTCINTYTHMHIQTHLYMCVCMYYVYMSRTDPDYCSGQNLTTVRITTHVPLRKNTRRRSEKPFRNHLHPRDNCIKSCSCPLRSHATLWRHLNSESRVLSREASPSQQQIEMNPLQSRRRLEALISLLV